MKIAHEAPLSIMNQVQRVTDYDYALVHLFKDSEQYYGFFQRALQDGREVILDNSIFELGTAFTGNEFAYWVTNLSPTWYIVPDVLDNADATINSFETFMDEFSGLPGKAIAVAQGETYNDVVRCYNYFKSDSRVEKIAFSFNHPFYQTEFSDAPTKYHAMMKGRQQMISRLIAENVIDTNKPHHLLGCGLPQEFKFYKEMHWIDSVDTSNPVMHGMYDIRYTPEGLENKESVKMHTLMEEDYTDKIGLIYSNIATFRGFCNGEREEMDINLLSEWL